MTEHQPEKPEEVLKWLSEGADPRRVRSLQTVHDVCEEQRHHGSRDYSLVTIGRLSKLRKGPGAAALGNDDGRVYRQLIASHRNTYAAPLKKARRATTVDAADPLARARIHQLEAEVLSLRTRITDLQRIANKTARVSVTGDGTESAKARFVGPVGPVLLPYEQEALETSLDPRRLRRAGLVVGTHGRLQTTTGEELFPIGFATGLSKTLAALGLLDLNQAPQE